MNRIVLGLIIVSSILISYCGKNKSTDYLLYNQLLNDNFISDPDTTKTDWCSERKFTCTKVELIVIESYTKSFPADFQYLKENMPDLDSSTYFDFINKNKIQESLDFDMLTKNIKIKFIDSNKTNDVYIRGNWNLFYKSNPKSQGVLTLSKIGYNTKGNQALIYLGNLRYLQDGIGYYLLFEQYKGKWIEKGNAIIWKS